MTDQNQDVLKTLEDYTKQLLTRPKKIDLTYRKTLIGAYHNAIDNLTTHFNSRSEVKPAFPINVYYYSDNHLSHDPAIKEIDNYLDSPINAVSFISGFEAPKVTQGYTLSQDWISGGFDFAQITRQGLSGVGKVTFLNCAPRIDERGQDGNTTNKGEPIYVGILPNGHVISANSRYNFAFFKDMIANGTLEVFEANVQPDGTQFRSRDIFPTHVAVLTNLLTQSLHLWKSSMSPDDRKEFLKTVGYVDLNKRLLAKDIPDLPQFTVANVDSHGNIKTNTRFSDLSEAQQKFLASGQEFTVILGETQIKGVYTPKMFDRGDKNPAGLSQGSSGANWQGSLDDFARASGFDPAHGLYKPNVDGFLEFSIIGGKASDELGVVTADIKKGLQLIIPELPKNDDAPAP